MLAFSAATRGPIRAHEWLSHVIELQWVKVFFLGKKNAGVDNFFSQPIGAAIGLPHTGISRKEELLSISLEPRSAAPSKPFELQEHCSR